MDWITVDTDTSWSGLSTTPGYSTGIRIDSGATLILDAPGEVQWIEIIDGTFEIETLSGRNYRDPTLSFADKAQSGIAIQSGELTIKDLQPDTTPPTDPTQEEFLRGTLDQREMAVIRSNNTVQQKSIELAKNRWFFLPRSLDWSLHNPHLLEAYNTYPLITYWEQSGDTALQRYIAFDYGITEMERVKEIDLHKNTVDGGSEIDLTYDRTSTKEWSLSGIFERRYSGKAKLKQLYHLSDTLQRDSPVLLVTDEMIKYVMVKNVEHEVRDNFYEWEMVVEEQTYPSADRLDITTGVQNQ